MRPPGLGTALGRHAQLAMPAAQPEAFIKPIESEELRPPDNLKDRVVARLRETGLVNPLITDRGFSMTARSDAGFCYRLSRQPIADLAFDTDNRSLTGPLSVSEKSAA